MPIENERKFVINSPSEDEAYDLAYDSKTISQGYTTINKTEDAITRIRSDTGNYLFTYKHYLNNKCIEIETEISQSDFHKLWSIAKNKLTKYRYLIKDDDNLHTWEIDYIYDDQGTYIAIAEIEMPENVIEVPIPKFVRDNLLYTVKEGDSRFQNCYLHDRRYVEDLLKDINVS